MGIEEGTALCKIPWGVGPEHLRFKVSARSDLKSIQYGAIADFWQIHLSIEVRVIPFIDMRISGMTY